MIDGHHHIWRQADLPWLNGRSQPRIFGTYDAIKRDYPIEEYLADIAGSGVEKSVYVQANWPPARAVDEAAWVQSVADEHGFPHAIVAYADLTDPACPDTLEALAAFPAMRGIRQQLHWHNNPQYRFAAAPDLCEDRVLRGNLARLEAYGWLFELQVFPGQFASAASLLDALPRSRFVLVHAGMLEDASPEGVEAWRRGLAALARRPNLFCKLSAFGTFVRRVDRDLIETITETAVEAFGPARCLWGSNFPIEKLWTDYPSLLGTHRAIIARYAADEQQAIIRETALRAYRLE